MRIMMTGGSGLLGRELLKLDAGLVAPDRDALDIRDGNAVAAFVDDLDPDIVIHAAAVTNNREVERDPTDALHTNVIGTANVALACQGRRTRLVYLSTDYVYRGDRGDYAETDELQPSNLYAWTKLSGEAAVRAVPNHLIIRTSFGAPKFDYPAAFVDKWSSKEYVDIIAPEILEAVRSPLTGVLHLGGPKRSLYDYARERNPGVDKIEIDASGVDTPKDTSLKLDRWTKYMQGEDVLRPVQVCRVCGSDALVRYLDLGMMPLANNLAPSAGAAKSMSRYPMQVQYCRECSLSQLTVVVDPREMFSHYTYRSSVNKGYVAHCREMARTVRASIGLAEGDLVVDIAGNDGTLLNEFRDETGVAVVNVDPAKNIAAIATSRNIPSIVEFWSLDVAKSIVAEHGKPKLVTATNVFAHVHDVHEFIGAVASCLADEGALLLEFPYAIDFIEHREFDTIYFEHLSYVLIEPVRKLAEQHGLKVFDVQKQDIHGGTARVFLGHTGHHEVRDSVGQFIEAERAGGFHGAERYLDWKREIDTLIEELTTELRALKDGGARIAAFAASAKGNTLLNACRLDASTINYIIDDTPEKIGRFSPGNGIPIVDRSVLESDPPDYLVILAWNFATEIMASIENFEGRFIMPIPRFKILEP